MIRHAQASFGKADYDRLSDLGHEQARLLAVHLSRIGVCFDAIYLGRQLRHAQTLEAYRAVCPEKENGPPPVRITDFFNEYDAGALLKTFVPILCREDPAFAAVAAKMHTGNRSFQIVLEKVLLRWFDHREETEHAESWASFTSRVQQGLREIMAREGPGKRVAVFTSGGPISVVVQKALSLSNQSTLGLLHQIVNSSVSRFKYNGEGVMLFGFNDFTHLELDDPYRLITYR
jgi:broad specificity phosphatase PhoE